MIPHPFALLVGLPLLVLVGLVAHRLVSWLTADPVVVVARAVAAPASAPPAPLVVAGWYHLELQGRGGELSGFVDEVAVSGVTFLRVREPDRCGGLEPDRLLTPRAVWRMSALTETACRREVLARWTTRPMGLDDTDEMPVRSVVVLRRVALDVTEAEDDGIDLSGTTADSEVPSARLVVRETVVDELESSGERERATVVDPEPRATKQGIGEAGGTRR